MTTMRLGLCSVTYRSLPAERIVALAVAAGLESIEWGGDVHVPAGDITQAERVAAVMADAGLVVASYGSYFRAGGDDDLGAVLDSAEALGAARVRIWAGDVDASIATPAYRAQVVERLQFAAATAGARGLELALEFHAGTLASSAAATLQLLAEVGSVHLSTYWQSSLSASDDDALAEYRALAAHTSAAHVFSWWPVSERHPLAARAGLWTRFFAEARARETPLRDALIEFVRDDDPVALATEAKMLRGFHDSVGVAPATLGSDS